MSDRRGQSETVGFALLLVLTIISVGALAVFGSAAIDSAQQQIGTQSAEHAMSQFDSRVAMVGLGRSETQTIDFGQSQSGTYTVEPRTGWMRISHYNYSGGSNTEPIYNRSMGSLTYRNGDTEIAYQGGGVWKKQSGGSVMISPPEFHYRGATLTLPALRVYGNGSVSGSPVAKIQERTRNHRIYPNSSDTYGAGGHGYRNPIGSGQVKVTVQSEYYEAWADYFRSRTDGNVTVDHSNSTATMELIALGAYGDFNMPLDGNSLTLRGLRTHQISDFTITLFHDQSDNANFNNLDWSFYATKGSKKYEINIVPVDKTKHGEPAKVTMYYTENGTSYQGWVTTTAYDFETESHNGTDWNNDGDLKDKRLVVNLTTSENITYSEVKTGGGGTDDGTITYFNPASDHEDPGTFSGHVTWEPQSYHDGDNETVNNVTNHYFAEMGPIMDLTVADQQQDSVEESISYGHLEYGGGNDYFLTYLHVTENEVNITVR